jgi:2-oxoglutarate dehydrogenase E2 component (dihydrolipoamide succinyltransferase)
MAAASGSAAVAIGFGSSAPPVRASIHGAHHGDDSTKRLKKLIGVAILGRVTTNEDTPAAPAEESRVAATEPVAGADRNDETAVTVDPADTLSPAVRRLVRQYDLDITGIHGTGPDGRIRVGDVISILGPRAEQAVHGPVVSRPAAAGDDGEEGELEAPVESTVAESPDSTAAVTTTIFDCELGRVLAHRKTLRDGDVDVLLTSYFVAACLEALDAVADVTAGKRACFGVHITTADARSRSARLDSADVAGTLTERLRVVDARLRAGVGADLEAANFLVHHYGASGSLLTTPTPIGAGHVASLGIGSIRREIVLRSGDDTPRVGLRCYLSLSFLPEHLTLARANEFLARAVRVLELWAD